MQHFIVKWRRPRKAALSPELNTYPETPPGFLSGFYPGSKRVEGQQVSFDIKTQTLPELNTYPVIQLNQYPAWSVRPVKRVTPLYILQSTSELNVYPQTVVDSLYPSWLTRPVEKVKNQFKLQLVPELNIYPQTPLDSPYPSWLTKPIKRVGQRHAIQLPPELDTYPETRISIYPSWLEKKTNKIQFKIKLQSLPELNDYREVGSPYPSWLEKKANKIIFHRKHIIVEELDFYPQIILSTALVLSLEKSIRVKSNNATKRRFITSERFRMVLGSIQLPWPTDIDDATLRSIEKITLLSKTTEITVISQTGKITLRSV